MPQQIEVIYENGVLRPIGPMPESMQEHQRYTITIGAAGGSVTRLDTACVAAAARDADPAVSLEDVRKILARVRGTLAEAVAAEREER
jgi:predicted DNA-binding antitoxin AbrB/MazE fold protein